MNLKRESNNLVSNPNKSEEFPILVQDSFIMLLMQKLNNNSKTMQRAVVVLCQSFFTLAELCFKPTKLEFFSTPITGATTFLLQQASYSKITYTPQSIDFENLQRVKVLTYFLCLHATDNLVPKSQYQKRNRSDLTMSIRGSKHRKKEKI